MDTAELTEVVRRLRALGSDDALVEAKSARGGVPKDVWSSVSAFANTDGGMILLGVSEADGFKPVSGFEPGPILDGLSEGLTQAPRPSAAKVTPIPDVTVEQVEFEGGVVVVLRVHPLLGHGGPCYVTDQGVERGSYIRWDDQNRHMSTYQVFLVRHRHDYLATDREPVASATLDDLDPDLTERMVRRLRARGSRALVGVADRTAELRRLNVVAADGVPTLAGMLALATYPQQFLPQAFVDVTVHPEHDKSDARSPVRFVDREVCEGPIPVMVTAAVAAVLRNLRTARVVEGIQGRDVPEIPEEVLREAIVNALTHRDYGPIGRLQQVAVDVYPDRIEVTSPGGFWGGVTVENVDSGQSRSRNDTLSKLLSNVIVAEGEGTISENQGSGVPAMISSMTHRGLPAPVFDDRLDAVRVTLHRFRLTAAPDARSGHPGLPSLGRRRPTPGEQAVLAALDTTWERSIQEISELTGRPVGGLRSILRVLVADGWVTPTAAPTSRARKYLLNPMGPRNADE